jgi:large subunit ribosomal protein L4
MKADVTTLEAKKAGTVNLSDDVFGLEPRSDILHRMVRYQLAKRRAGTVSVKDRSQITGSTAKIMNQKGSGRARHSTRKANLFRGGGKSFGPKPRDYSISLPKKVRALALRHALSAKAKSNELIVLDNAALKSAKTGGLKKKLAKLGLASALIVDGAELEKNFSLAARNIIGIDVLAVQGINVYDILRREKLVLTKAAVEALEARFK